MKKILLGACLALTSQLSLAVTDVYRTSSHETYPNRQHDAPTGYLGSCGAEDFDWMIGRGSTSLNYLSNDETRVRIILPGRVYTMEYVPDRLNFHINRQGLVERVSCG